MLYLYVWQNGPAEPNLWMVSVLAPAEGTRMRQGQFSKSSPTLSFLSKLRPMAILATAGSALLVGCSDEIEPMAGCRDTSPQTASLCTDDRGIICTWAGNGLPGWDGDCNGLLNSSFYWPIDLTFTPSGEVYILDWNNHRVRRVNQYGALETVIGTYTVGDGPLPDSDVTDLQPPGAPGTLISLNHPTGIAPLPDGKLLLASWHNHKLRRYDPETGLILVVCGAGAGFDGDGGPAKDALLWIPTQALVANNGSVYVLDQGNQRIRKIDTNDIITTVAGTGVAGYSGDGGSPVNAQLNFPAGGSPSVSGALAIDDQDRLYVSDSLNQRIRRIDFDADLIETIAGNGNADFGGDGGPAVNASFNNPRDIELSPDGNQLYVADEFNHRVRVIDLNTGIIKTVAGNGVPGFAGDGGPATDASLNRPVGLAFDLDGRLYIADTENHRIRSLVP